MSYFEVAVELGEDWDLAAGHLEHRKTAAVVGALGVAHGTAAAVAVATVVAATAAVAVAATVVAAAATDVELPPVPDDAAPLLLPFGAFAPPLLAVDVVDLLLPVGDAALPQPPDDSAVLPRPPADSAVALLQPVGGVVLLQPPADSAVAPPLPVDDAALALQAFYVAPQRLVVGRAILPSAAAAAPHGQDLSFAVDHSRHRRPQSFPPQPPTRIAPCPQC